MTQSGIEPATFRLVRQCLGIRTCSPQYSLQVSSITNPKLCRRSRWPRGLRRKSAAARSWGCGFESHWGHGCLSVVSVVCCWAEVCDELITRPEESYRLWCVVVCYLETSWMRNPWPTGGCRPKNKQICWWHYYIYCNNARNMSRVKLISIAWYFKCQHNICANSISIMLSCIYANSIAERMNKTQNKMNRRTE